MTRECFEANGITEECSMLRYERKPMWSGVLVSVAVLMLLLAAEPRVQGSGAQAPTPVPGRGADIQRKVAVGGITAPWKGDLDGMIERRYIRVATTYNKTHYFIDKAFSVARSMSR